MSLQGEKVEDLTIHPVDNIAATAHFLRQGLANRSTHRRTDWYWTPAGLMFAGTNMAAEMQCCHLLFLLHTVQKWKFHRHLKIFSPQWFKQDFLIEVPIQGLGSILQILLNEQILLIISKNDRHFSFTVLCIGIIVATHCGKFRHLATLLGVQHQGLSPRL